mgnify:CR=1 FL=1
MPRQRIRRRLNAACTSLAVAGFALLLTGCFWTHTEWTCYVVRDDPFDWWAPACIAGGIGLLTGTAVLATKLDL